MAQVVLPTPPLRLEMANVITMSFLILPTIAVYRQLETKKYQYDGKYRLRNLVIEPAISISRLKSIARTLWVSAPTEMKSTPVRGDVGHALQRHVAGGLRLGAAGDQRHAGAHLVERHVVEQDDIDAQRDDFGNLVEAVDFHLEHGVGIERARGLDRLGQPCCPCP